MTLFSIPNQNNMLYTYFQRQSKYVLYIIVMFTICRLLYGSPVEKCSFTSSFLCVFIFAFSFLLRFSALLFSLICVSFLRNIRFRSLKYASSFFSKNKNDVNLAVASTVQTCHVHCRHRRDYKCPVQCLVFND